MRCFPGVFSREKYRIQASPVPACGINEDLFACVRSAVFPDFQVSSARIPECSCVVLYKFEGVFSLRLFLGQQLSIDFCIMKFLLSEGKDVLLEVAKKLRVEVDITLPKIEFKRRICQRNRTTEVSEPVNKCRPLINPVVNKSVENARSCDFENENCDPQSKGVANPEGLICENICEEKYTIGTLMGCEKQLILDRESFRNHTMAKIAGQLVKWGKRNMCKADVRKGLEDGLAMRLPLSERREIYKDSLETDNRSNIGSEFNFKIDLPGKRDRRVPFIVLI
ncbi:uncharacterized protein TNCV_2854511 [Trichonephila clavipes]|nr:uncharacterized protein TNCV_2854511 [Trichonephila clavipes]